MAPLLSRRVLSAALVFPLIPALLLAEPVPKSAAAPAVGPAATTPTAVPATDFVRFVEDTTGARLETGIATYRNNAGVTVDLIGAVHVGDAAYYKKLNEQFKGYEVVLYEMVGGPIEKREERMAESARPALPPPGSKSPVPPENKAPGTEGKREPSLEERVANLEKYVESGEDATKESAAASKLSWLQGLHTTLQNTLDLQGQLEGIDYHAPNFVHADMSLAQFSDMQTQRNEGFIALWIKAVQVQMNQPQTQGNQPGLLKILEILCRQDSATELKRLIGRTFDSVETLMTGMEAGDGTVIVSERNKVALRVLTREIAAGRKHLGIFYGAAHLPDMEKRLAALGFTREKSSWITAWDLPPAAPETQDLKTQDTRQNP